MNTTLRILSITSLALALGCGQEPQPEPAPAQAPPTESCVSGFACATPELVERCVGDFCLRTLDHFALVEPGVFTMGADPDEPGWTADERFRLVGVSRPFFIQKTEVTRAQWNALMPHDPSSLTDDASLPVHNVSFYDALAYCNALSDSEGLEPCYDLSSCEGTPGLDYRCDAEPDASLTCGGYRLPTDAEWEFASRAGSPYAFYNGPWGLDDAGNAPRLEVIGWYDGNATSAQPVATRAPNAFGLFDTQGNVLEWTFDNVGRDDNELLITDPVGAVTFDGSKTSRGGSWALPADRARLGHRAARVAFGRRDDQGFRPARTFNTVLPVAFDDFGDRDADGLAWPLEVNGWTIVVDDAGYGEDIATSSVLRVTSEPEVADTDGDGLTDLEEYELRTHPRRADTDGDGLTDLDEVRRWGTNPRSIDSDGDARGPDRTLLPVPALFDAAELQLDADGNAGPGATSPIEDDTDGDGFSDYAEVNSPLIADVPYVRLAQLPDSEIDVFLNATSTEGDSTSLQFGSSISSSTTKTQSMGASFSAYAGVFVEVGIEGSLKVAGSGVSVGAAIEETAGIRMGYETQNTFGVETVRELQRQSNALREGGVSQGFSFDSGTIRYPLLLVNESDFSFAVSDLVVNVFYTTREDGRLRPLGALTPMPLSPEEYVLGPRGTAVAVLENTELDPDRIRQFFDEAVGLTIRPSYYTVRSALAQNGLPYLEEKMAERCAAIEIDLGPDDVRQYRVAAHVGRDADGDPTGVSLVDVLSELDVETSFTSSINPYDGTPVDLLEINGAGVVFADPMVPAPNTDPPYVYSEPPGARRVLSGWFARVLRRGEPGAFFTDDPASLRLFPGDKVTFFYGSDFDRDGLNNREEALLGTDPTLYDTDGDGLSDYFEVREGWIVSTVVRASSLGPEPPPEGRRVFPDPRVADYDGDGWNDRLELLLGGPAGAPYLFVDPRGLGTDPYLPDTDSDGVDDPRDAALVNFNSNGPLRPPLELLEFPLRFDGLMLYYESDYWSPGGPYAHIRIPTRRNNRVSYRFRTQLYTEYALVQVGSPPRPQTQLTQRPITRFELLRGSAGDALEVLSGLDPAEFLGRPPTGRVEHDVRFQFNAAGEFEFFLLFEQAPGLLTSHEPCVIPFRVKVVDEAIDPPRVPNSVTRGLDPDLARRLPNGEAEPLLRVEYFRQGKAWCTIYGYDF
jgi:formylglycine-generating enzyme required for sulfatase activity